MPFLCTLKLETDLLFALSIMLLCKYIDFVLLCLEYVHFKLVNGLQDCLKLYLVKLLLLLSTSDVH